MPVQQVLVAVGQSRASRACYAIAHAVPRVEMREALHLGPRLLQPLRAAEHLPTALPRSPLVLLDLRGVARLVRRVRMRLRLWVEFKFGSR